MKNIRDQRFAVGSDLSYQIGPTVDSDGQMMIVFVELGLAEQFTSYDSDTSLIKVNSK